jgi:hypothetical protein
MRRYLKFLLFSFLFCVRMEAVPPTQNFSIKAILSQIPKDDYEALDQLFRTLVIENYFAYTLFGSKPMTHKGVFYGVLTRERSKDNEGDQIFLTYWEIWKKYASRPEFQTPNYFFVEKKLPELFEIHFLNRKNVLACVQEYLSTFKEILGEGVTPEKIYYNMITSNDVYEALGNSQILYGILFGFGEKNARGYHEKFELELDIPEPIFFNDEEQKPNHLSLPYFSVFGPNRETDLLRKTYQQERRRILSLYSKGNFLEITLTKLLSND